MGSLFRQCVVCYMAVFADADVGYAAAVTGHCAGGSAMLSEGGYEGEYYAETAGGGVEKKQ